MVAQLRGGKRATEGEGYKYADLVLPGLRAHKRGVTAKMRKVPTGRSRGRLKLNLTSARDVHEPPCLMRLREPAKSPRRSEGARAHRQRTRSPRGSVYRPGAR